MNTLKKFMCLGGTIALATAITGCHESGTEPIFKAEVSEQEIEYSSSSSTNKDVDYYELSYNYDLLDLYYIYGHRNNELDDFEAYLNQSAGRYNSKSYCTKQFEKVCNMYGDMSDPFTRYFDPYYARSVMQMLTESESLVGIGVDVREVVIDDTTRIVINQVYENSPADDFGLLEEDVILTIDGKSVTSAEEFEKLTSGNIGDKITIEVFRDDTTKTLTVKLGEYNMPTVFLSYRDSIPVINITEFTASTTSDKGTHGEFVNALKKIKDDYKAAIIDLRGNPGGDVDQCNAISAELLSAGDTIIIDIETNIDSSGRGDNKTYFQKLDTTAYTADVDGIGKDLYYVFLADGNSASCAEVLLSAITVNKKSPVVGQITYGKGIGQYVIETYYVANGLALITGLESMDKNGDIYHKVGIVPDYSIKNEEEQMEKALEIAKNAVNGKEEKRTAGYGTESTGHFAKVMARGNNVFPTTKKILMDQLGGAYKIKK